MKSGEAAEHPVERNRSTQLVSPLFNPHQPAIDLQHDRRAVTAGKGVLDAQVERNIHIKFPVMDEQHPGR